MVQKEIIGKVISTVRDKTVTVAVERKIAHCKYHKIITRTKSLNYLIKFIVLRYLISIESIRYL